MNFHQSKGLEFDIVVLPELKNPLIGQAPSFVADRPRPSLPVETICKYVGREERGILPENLQQIFERYTNREIAESMCVLYVAVTRAVHAMHMIVPPSNSKSIPKTMAGLVCAALAPDEALSAERTLFEAGDPQWNLRMPPSKTLPLPQEISSEEGANNAGEIQFPLPIPAADSLIVFSSIRQSSQRGLHKASPSGLEGGARLSVRKMLQSASNQNGMQRGLLMHAWFELIEWLDQGEPSSMQLLQIANEIADDSINVALLANEFMANLRKPIVAAPLRQDFYSDLTKLGFPQRLSQANSGGDVQLQVLREQAFSVPVNDQIVTGTFDRVVLIRQGEQVVAADIVDFKSDRIASDDEAAELERREHYRPQIEMYRRVVEQQYRLPPEYVQARLVFTHPGNVVPL
jgi:ATP-dependent helicase/nuclease subunit A